MFIMGQNYHAGFTASITCQVIAFGSRLRHAPEHQGATGDRPMLPLTFTATRAVVTVASDVLPWLAKFATRLVARRLDVPEIVVHGICLYVAAYVGEVERNASLVCPLRVFLDLRGNRLAARDRSSSSPSPHKTRAA
jgi:hypothetical protein